MQYPEIWPFVADNSEDYQLLNQGLILSKISFKGTTNSFKCLVKVSTSWLQIAYNDQELFALAQTVPWIITQHKYEPW